MAEPVTLARVVVGSQLHGLALPESDTDVRLVWASNLGEILSPWTPTPPEMGPDEDGWELRHFVGLITRGNSTVLEVLSSDIHEGAIDPRWPELQALMPAMLDPETVRHAHFGYIVSQRKLIEDARRREDFRRMAKAAVAALRIANQGAELLRTAVLTPKVTRHRDLLLAIRADGLSDDREAIWRRELDLAVTELNDSTAAPHPSLRLDREAVISFLSSAYR